MSPSKYSRLRKSMECLKNQKDPRMAEGSGKERGAEGERSSGSRDGRDHQKPGLGEASNFYALFRIFYLIRKAVGVPSGV